MMFPIQFQSFLILLVLRNSTKVKLRINDTKAFHYYRQSELEMHQVNVYLGHAVAWLVEALCYKTEGRGFVSR
jgi:hypothetical protein